ncbi:MAG TPA: hypothetical protein VHT91_10385 [Kofleriaceae bacterium]|nr:hypothetical protein [Kofleriaceae bacterium]
MLRSVIAILLPLTACAPPSPTPALSPPVRSPSQTAAGSPELSPALAPLAWWLGDWDARDGDGSEHWIAAAGAIYGVALHGGRSGELGFTVGKAAFTGARAEGSWRSTYATIWRHQPNGSWKVLFDTGRIVQDL